MTPLVTRREAVAIGARRYFTGEPCKHGHVAERRVIGSACVACANARAIDWAERHPERTKEIRNRHAQENIDRIRLRRRRENLSARQLRKVYEQDKRFYEANKEERRQYALAYRHANIDKRLEYDKKRAKDPLISRPKSAARNIRRRVACAHLSPLERFEIRIIYEEAALLGPKFHVDHIVPIARGGRHHPSNLQIVTSGYNLRKGDRIFQERKYV